MLIAHAQAAPPDALQVWVGVFGVAQPAPPSLRVEGGAGTVATVSALAPIHDGVVDATKEKRPLDHRAILRVTGLEPSTPYRLQVASGTESRELLVRTLPRTLPQKLEGTFDVLLCSCYSQPEDASGLVGTIVSQILPRPQLTLMLGDQIYGDLPIFENLPGDDPGVARVLGAKYRRNWASSQLGGGGLEPVLARAPFACVADDHEYWNNYPYSQTQLPKTWTEKGREQWRRCAKALYEDYQVSGTNGAQRIDVDPLKILMVDMRTERDEAFGDLVPASTFTAIDAWAQDLCDRRAANEPAFGMLVSGQALFVSPTAESKRRREDAEMSNYAQFERELLPVLERLSDASVPVLYVTGDVHWGRLAQGRDMRTGRIMLHEVIASPSRLIRVPVIDAAKEAAAKLRGIFGHAPTWPRHGEPAKVPRQLGSKGRFWLECDLENQWGHARQGDQVAVLSLCRAGAGIDFRVTYYGVSNDKTIGRPDPTRTFELRNL